LAREAAGWLGEQLAKRTASRFARGLVPLVGVALGAGMSAWNVRSVTRHPLRPPAPDELLRLASDIASDPEAYAEARHRYAELDEPE
jgi:hypothetical protein